MSLLLLAFWLSCGFIGYVYAGYPGLLWLLVKLRSARGTGRHGTGSPARYRPPVSIIVAARNEAARLPARLQNLLQLDYPLSRRQIIVVSDGSTDDTATVLAPYASRVELVSVPAGGKALALNAGVARAHHDLLVFADARQAFAADALVELTAPFQDETIGAVTGELLLDGESPGRRRVDRRGSDTGCPHGPIPVEADGGPPESSAAAQNRRIVADRRRTLKSTIADGVGLYWRYEKQIRRHESAVGSLLGVTGAIYAMRRSLWKPLPADTILDDVLAPMRAVLAGYRIVFSERARAFDRVAPDADAEARRKIRTLAGNYQILWLEPRLLLPFRNPVWFQYMSHKVGRLLVPYALLVLFVSSVALASRGPIYAAALFAQCCLYLLAGYGAWLDLQGAPMTTGAPSGSRAAIGWADPRPIDRTGAVNA